MDEWCVVKNGEVDLEKLKKILEENNIEATPENVCSILHKISVVS